MAEDDRALDEGLGKLHFWLQFVGFNQPSSRCTSSVWRVCSRRYASYGEESGWWFWNVVVSVGALLIGASILIFLHNVARTFARGEPAGDNLWDAATLEWAIPSPPPVYNFREIPLVRHRDPLWIEKYGDEAHGQEQQLDVTIAGVKIAEGETPDEAPVEQAARRLQAEDEHTAFTCRTRRTTHCSPRSVSSSAPLGSWSTTRRFPSARSTCRSSVRLGWSPWSPASTAGRSNPRGNAVE